MMRTVLVCVLALLLGMSARTAHAQRGTTDPPKTETEVHEGVWGMVEYFGGRLLSELGDRLSLNEADSSVAKVPTKVIVRVGGLEVERTEMRAIQTEGGEKQ